MNSLQAQVNRRPSVLLVDDDPENLEVLIQLLSYESLDIAVAHSGQTALAKINELKPDLILLDVDMPGMSGYEVCKQVKSQPETRDIAIIFLTGVDDFAHEEKGLSLGAVDYITKPFLLPILKARVRNQVELQKKTRLLESMVRLDGLTSIPNRRYFDTQMEREWNRCIRSGRALSLLMIDVDHFKQYNDHYGHTCGDECLKRIAEALDSALRRSGDLLARYGGEEFVVLLPETEESDALVVAEHLRKNVLDLKLPHAKSPVSKQVTVSIGCSSRIPEVGQSSQALITAADNHLYQAKAMGRNTIIMGSWELMD